MNAFVAGTTIRVERSGLFGLDRREWDRFAQTCDASFKCSAYNFGANFDHVLSGRRMFFIFYARSEGIETRIAQCALRSFDGAFHFEDRLQILPEYDDYWVACMRALLAQLGSGRYCYGSLWNMDCARHELLSRIEGAEVTTLTRYRMQYVDFAAFPDWEHYAKSLHKNVQRNLKKATNGPDDVRIEIRRGLSAMKLLGKSNIVRKRLFEAKGMPFSRLSVAFRTAIRILSFRRYAVSAAIIEGEHPVGVFSGIQFGRSLFYIDGGSLPGNRGLSWTLLVGMIRDAYERAPNGFFVFGWELEGSTEAKELIWSRQQCNISERPSSQFEFTYVADAALTARA